MMQRSKPPAPAFPPRNRAALHRGHRIENRERPQLVEGSDRAPNRVVAVRCCLRSEATPQTTAASAPGGLRLAIAFDRLFGGVW